MGAPQVSLLDDETKLVTSRLGLTRFRVAGTADMLGDVVAAGAGQVSGLRIQTS